MEQAILDILDAIRANGSLDAGALDRILRARSAQVRDGRKRIAKKHILPFYLQIKRDDPERWASWGVDEELERRFIACVRMKPRRSASGVATITVITKPHPCAGDCVYCPNDVRMPKSYLHDEPACQRAERNFFDPYLQVASRLSALERMGHATDKVELIVLGGSFTDYPTAYQTWFVCKLFCALNDASSSLGDAGDVFAGETPRVRSLDFLSGSALHTADSARSVLESLNGIPDLPDGSESALYLELAGTSDEALEETLMLLADELELHGFDLDNTWVATDLQGVERFHAFRHAVPEQLNARLDTLRQKEPALHRASVDLACEPSSCAAHMEALVNRTGGLPVSSAVYGHVLDGRIHVDLLPETKEDLLHCEAFFRGLSMNPFLRAGAENGIGKLKRDLLRLSLTEEEYKLFCAVKGFFDPQGLWNPGSFIPD